MSWRRRAVTALFAVGLSVAGAPGCSRATPSVRADPERTAARRGEPGEGGRASPLDEVPIALGSTLRDAGRVAPGATTAAATPAAREAPAAEVSVPADHRVLYELAAHPERAELRHMGATVIDLGSPGDARYTLGGFHTGTTRAARDAGASVLRIAGGRLLLQVPCDLEGAGVLTVRGRGGRAAVSIDGRAAGTIELPTDGLGVGSLPVASRSRRGDLAVQLRFTSPDARVDWVRIGPPGDSTGDVEPPAPDVLVRHDQNGESLFLRAGWTAGFHLDVPAGALLAGLVTSPSPATVEVVAVTDEQARIPLGTVRATPAGAALRVDLGAVSGKVARIDLQATSERPDGVLRILRPRVTAPRGGPAPGERRRIRNAIVLLVDTLRADRVSAIDASTRVRTPGIESFSRGAATFLGARTQECWTKPSVATLLSSWMPWQHGAVRTSSRFPDEAPMLSELLRRAGFHTEALVANGYVGDRFGFRRGWHFWRNYVAESRRNRADVVVRDVLDRLDRRDPARPFFFYVHTIDPHVPYTPPARFVRMYDPESYSGVVRWETADFLDRVKLGQIALNARDRRHLQAQYDGEISFHDVHFQALIDGLESRGLAEDTLLVLTADHGEEFWEHGNVGHGHSVFDELVHVPLFVRAPGIVPAGVRSSAPAGLVDIAPTVLDALGVERPASFAGRSLLPTLRGEDESAPAVVVSGFMDDRRAAAAGRWKLILRGTRTELFDVLEDARETRDVATAHPVALRYMRELTGLALASTQGGASRGQPRRARPQQDVTIDAETERQLRELGYIPETRR